MRLVQGSPESVEFYERTPVQAPVLVGALLVLCPAAMSLVSPLPLTTTRMTAAAVLGLVGAGIVLSALPRSRRVVLRPSARTITDASGEKRWGDDPKLCLVAAPPALASGAARYGVCLQWRDAPPILLSSANEPSRVLRDLIELRRFVPLPVEGGWGLTPDATWVDASRADGPGLARRDATVRDEHDDTEARRRIATTLLVGSAAVATLLTAEAFRRVTDGETSTLLSLALPFLPVLVLLVAGSALSTAEWRLTAPADLLCELRVCGLTLRRRSVNRGAIRGAWLVAPDGGAPRHLLLHTDEGPLAFDYDAPSSSRILEQLDLGRDPAPRGGKPEGRFGTVES